jgi:hypothetical protein
VNAPGSENTTTVLPLNISSLDTFFQSLPRRVRKVTWGTYWPSRIIAILCIGLNDEWTEYVAKQLLYSSNLLAWL